MKKRSHFILILFLLFSSVCISQKRAVTAKEEIDTRLFKEFTNYLAGSIDKKEDINDSIHLKYILLHYLFTNKKPDSKEGIPLNNFNLSTDELENLRKELNAFSNFLQQTEKDHHSDNLTLMPTRFGRDTSFYRRLTKFQQENSFILYDKRFPDKTLGYLLFVPTIKNINVSPRIWSWTLMFKFGKYVFKSVTGEEGYEYIFSPKN
jgi:hypothetical protein